MSSPDNTRRHRAGENPKGRPARDLVAAYLAAAAALPRTQLARTA